MERMGSMLFVDLIIRKKGISEDDNILAELKIV